MRGVLASISLASLVLAGCQAYPPTSIGAAASRESGRADVHWGYAGEVGPENWGKLDQKFIMCAIGRNQSPIDIAATVQAELPPLRFDYVAGASAIRNNGHTVQVDYAPGSALTVDGRAFAPVRFHFHAPSENTFDGKRLPLEGHLVHSDKEGNLAVVAVMFTVGAANAALAAIWSAMPAKAGETRVLSAAVDAAALLPADRSYYRYAGSLTTPPCSEGVRWLVMAAPVDVSPAQVEQFAAALPGPNNRPVQPLNARMVLR